MTDGEACRRANDAIVDVCGNPHPDDFDVGHRDTDAGRELLDAIIANEVEVSDTFLLDVRPDRDCEWEMFKDETELFFDYDDRFVIEPVCIKTLQFLRLQIAASTASPGDVTLETFFGNVERTLTHDKASERYLDMIGAMRNQTESVPIPVVELTRRGEVAGFQEGRHRGVAAWLLGEDYTPIWLALNTRDDDGFDGTVPTRFRIRGHLEDHIRPLYRDATDEA